MIGFLAIRARFIVPVFTVLLIVAGFCYIVDAIGGLFALGFPITLASFGFVGEVVIIVWLLIKGRKLTN